MGNAGVLRGGRCIRDVSGRTLGGSGLLGTIQAVWLSGGWPAGGLLCVPAGDGGFGGVGGGRAVGAGLGLLGVGGAVGSTAGLAGVGCGPGIQSYGQVVYIDFLLLHFYRLAFPVFLFFKSILCHHTVYFL